MPFSQQQRELAVRIALGASREIASLVFARASYHPRSAWPSANSSVRRATDEQLLFAVSAADPATFIAVPVLLATVAVLAAWLPVRRATAVDPLIALRSE
jgi:putative ABC transport system permease protein